MNWKRIVSGKRMNRYAFCTITLFVGMLEININSAEVLYKQKEKQSMSKMEYMPLPD